MNSVCNFCMAKRTVGCLLLACAVLCSAPSAEENGSGVVIRPRVGRVIDVTALTRALKSDDFKEVRAAAQEAADSHNPKALTMLIGLAMEGDAQRRMLAYRSLGRLNVPGAEESLFRFSLGDYYVSLRLAAVQELARLETQEKAAARYVNVLTNDTSPMKHFRYRAVQALAQIGGKAASECLTQLISSPQTEFAVAATEGLGQQPDFKNAEALITALGSTDADIKAAAVDALEKLSGERFRFDLVKWSQWQKEHASGVPPKKEISPSEKPADDSDTPAKHPDAEPLDLVIVFDTTGSMLHIWPELSAALDALLADLVKRNPSLRLGTVKYRAADPEHTLTYMIKAKPLTRKIADMREDILDATFGGGSGGLQLGLDYAVRAMPWRVFSRKVVLLVGDTSPPDDGARGCFRTIAEAWQMDGILVNTLYVRTQHGSEHFDTYRLLALSGKGRFYEYNKAERHLVDYSAEKVDVKIAETPEETVRKLCAPRPAK